MKFTEAHIRQSNLLFSNTQLTKDKLLNQFSKQYQTAVSHIDDSLEKNNLVLDTTDETEWMIQR